MTCASFLLSAVLSGEIVLPTTLARCVRAIYRTNRQASGKGELTIRWSSAVWSRIGKSRSS